MLLSSGSLHNQPKAPAGVGDWEVVDLRRRRVVDVIKQGLSCRQAAERFGVSASSAIRWLDRLKKHGNVAAKRQRGDRKSGRIGAEAAFLLGEVAETPDMTLVELQEKLKARGVSVGIGALFRPATHHV